MKYIENLKGTQWAEFEKEQVEMQKIQSEIIKQALTKANNALEFFVKETLRQYGYKGEITKELLDKEKIVLHQYDYNDKVKYAIMRGAEKLGETFTIHAKLDTFN
jgi:hypothetical protein